jgi:hypothetical protein
MIKYLLAIAFACGAAPLSFAETFIHAEQCSATVSPQVTNLLSQFPEGGPILCSAIAQLVEASPYLVDEVVFAARVASPGQKQAIGEGLADAALFFAKCGSCGNEEARVRIAMICADSSTRAAFVVASMPTLPLGFFSFTNAGAATSGCVGPVVSPSKLKC